MDDYIAISTLNDFIFCPYSIYLHNVYMEMDEGVYHAVPQTRGRIAHETVDNKKTSNRSDELQALPIISERYGLTGKIDIYRRREKKRVYAQQARQATDYNGLMGNEGIAAKAFFSAYFQDMDWHGRMPRVKSDYLNATLDIGYTYLFNFIDCFVRMFGFDLYVGVYHRLWFKRKSLVCDLMEPFRCIIDKTIRTAISRKQFCAKDYDIVKGEYRLKREMNKEYSKVFFDALVPYKSEIFKYVQSYYRCFMGSKDISFYPKFEI